MTKASLCLQKSHQFWLTLKSLLTLKYRKLLNFEKAFTSKKAFRQS